MAIQEGAKAPLFSLRDAAGQTVSLSDFAGRHVVLYFYPRDNTSGCTAEAEGFRDRADEFARRGAVLIGVSPDSPESHAGFAAKLGLPFTLLSDPDHEVMTEYGAWGDKVSYGKPTRGVIRSTVWIGPDGRVVKHWARVGKAAAHPAEVLDALDS